MHFSSRSRSEYEAAPTQLMEGLLSVLPQGNLPQLLDILSTRTCQRTLALGSVIEVLPLYLELPEGRFSKFSQHCEERLAFWVRRCFLTGPAYHGRRHEDETVVLTQDQGNYCHVES